MQVDEHLLNCVAFIGTPTEHGFSADGTCFAIAIEEETEKFVYLITARHLVRPVKFGIEQLPLEGIVRVRLPRINSPPSVLETKRGDWICHPDRHVDICIFPFDVRANNKNADLSLSMLMANGGDTILFNEAKADAFGPLRLGDDIFIPSLFTGHIGERRNIPTLRVGNIAALPVESIRSGSPTKPAFLIETRSLGGTSGAPVFLHLQPSMRFGENIASSSKERPTYRYVPYLLIGILVGAHSGRYASDFIAEDDESSIFPVDADFNAGISIALPINLVMEVIYGDDQGKSRKMTIEAIRNESGFRPSSASRVRSEPLSTEDSPSHKEDFMRLVTAAAKKKPQVD